MAVLSSQTLFHFRRDIEKLKDCLLHGLAFGYLGESIADTKIAYYVNEICFCNIPLSMIDEHSEWYGHYAIGLKRHVAREWKATPVQYIHSKSPQISHSSSEKNVEFFRNSKMTPYLKPYKGKQFKSQEDGYKDKHFYDEKEWRIVRGDVIVEKYQNKRALYDRSVELAEIHKCEERFPIGIDDIEYIILNNYKEFQEFSDFVNGNFPDHAAEYLSKLLYLQQIKRDF